MVDVRELQAAVDAAFLRTGRGSAPWPDPHPDRSAVPDEAYSRLTDPARWRILGARADVWLIAVADAGLASVEPDGAVTWAAPPRLTISRTARAVPVARGALALVVARSRIGDVDDAGLVLGVGDPAECINWFPDCGCDACDSGSDNELVHLDTHIRSVITGTFRRLVDGKRVITVIDDDSWSASGFDPTGRRTGRQVEDVLADARGWTELTGSPWLDTT